MLCVKKCYVFEKQNSKGVHTKSDKNGLKTEPCGTPQETEINKEKFRQGTLLSVNAGNEKSKQEVILVNVYIHSNY